VSVVHAQSVDGTLTDSVSHVPIPGVIVTLLGPARHNDNNLKPFNVATSRELLQINPEMVGLSIRRFDRDDLI
jgi:hypothetical protein